MEEAKYEWRSQYDVEWHDGLAYDPGDYETEEEYLEALEKAKNEWRDEYRDDWYDLDLDPDDYETEEEYLEAREEALDK